MEGIKQAGAAPLAAGMATETARQNLHVDLDEAINDLHSINNHLDELLAKIRGIETGKAENIGVPRETPSLSEVLHGGSAQIRDRISRAHDIINEIDSELF